MQMPNGNLEHLWRAFIHDTDTAAKTKDVTKSDTFLNTTTCWLKMNIEDTTAGHYGSTIEALGKAIGSNLVNTVDLIVLAGDSDVSPEAAVNGVLGLEDEDNGLWCSGSEDDRAADLAAASLELRQHLLRACNLQAPTMYAAFLTILSGSEACSCCVNMPTAPLGFPT